MVHPVARKTLRRPLALSVSSLRPFIDIASPALAREALALRRLKPGPGFGSRIRAKSLGCEIRFQTRLKGRDLVVRVSDTGPGIPEHLRTRVFEPFFTTKEKGTGLGLGICFGIVRDHGGAIELEAGHETGAHFRIVIPVVDSEESGG